MFETWRMPQLPSLVGAPALVLWIELLRLNCSSLVYWMNSGPTGNVIGAATTVAAVSAVAANTARKTVKRVDERISILLIPSHSEEPSILISNTIRANCCRRDLTSRRTAPVRLPPIQQCLCHTSVFIYI